MLRPWRLGRRNFLISYRARVRESVGILVASQRTQGSTEAGPIDQSIEPKPASLDSKPNATFGISRIKMGKFSTQSQAGLGSEVIESTEVVMAVPFHVRHAELGLKTEVLLEGDAAEVGEILPALEETHGARSAAMFEQSTIGDRTEDALASLDADPGVPKIDGTTKCIAIRVRLVDDHRCDPAEACEAGPLRFFERLVSRKGLFDQGETPDHRRGRGIALEIFQQAGEAFEIDALFVAIEGKDRLGSD